MQDATKKRLAQKRPGNRRTQSQWQNQGEARRLQEARARQAPAPTRASIPRTASTAGRRTAAPMAAVDDTVESEDDMSELEVGGDEEADVELMGLDSDDEA